MNELFKKVCDEIRDIERDGLKAGNMDALDTLLNIKKNILKVEQLEQDSEYSNDGGNSYRYSRDDGGNSMYSGRHYVRGHYSNDGASSYARMRDSRGRYSRAEAKESMLEKMQDLMSEATTEKERKIVREAMEKVEMA